MSWAAVAGSSKKASASTSVSNSNEVPEVPDKVKNQPPYIKRLYQDLKHLKEEPIVGANAEPLDNDMLTWYGIILGSEGTPYAGIPIRFCLEFTDEYPNEPPKAFFETHIEYDGGVQYKDESGRTVICLNIFGNLGHVHTEWATMAEGWSPSYTVHTILLSMQALFLSDMLSDYEYSVNETRKSALAFKCPKTGHDGSIRSRWFPSIITDYKIAAEIAAKAGRVGYDVLRDFYICYVNKSTAKDPKCLLGYGIHLENNRTFSSPCEYLSKRAFDEGTRRGATNRPFEYWLPILINTEYKGKFMEQLNSAVETIVQAQPQLFATGMPPFAKLFKICSSVMNNLVVEIMNNAGDITANDKFINGYIAFYRLLISCAAVDARLVNFANNQIRKFIAAPENRVKSAVPNLGELLIFLTIADKYIWDDIATPFMEECDTRNVYWYISKEDGLDRQTFRRGRAQKVFELTPVSRNLVMYQVKFSKLMKTLSPEILDANFGLAPDEIRFELKDIFNMVQTVNCWDDFFDWVGMPRVAENVRDEQLLQALQRSFKQGYHGRDRNNRNFNNNANRGRNNNRY